MANRVRGRSSFRVLGRGARRKVTWGISAFTTAYTTLPAASAIFAQVFDPRLLGNVASIESTIVRVRGILSVRSDQASVVEEQFGSLGFIIISDAQASVGITSIPIPQTDGAEDGWFVWVPFMQDGIQGSANKGSNEYVIESKAMRKLESGTQMAVVVENSHSTEGLEFAMNFRFLMKLA